MKKAEYAMLNSADKAALKANEVWSTCPSGSCFQGFRHLYIEVSVGVVEHRTQAVYENGFKCEPTCTRRLIVGASMDELTEPYLAAQGQDVKVVRIPKVTEPWQVYDAVKRAADFHPHVRVEYCPY
jgi:hypothetical protein